MLFDSTTANVIRTLGIIVIIAGCIAAVVCGFVFKASVPVYIGSVLHGTKEVLNWGLMLGGMAFSAMSGILMIGFAHVVENTHRTAWDTKECVALLKKIAQQK